MFIFTYNFVTLYYNILCTNYSQMIKYFIWLKKIPLNFDVGKTL